MYQQRVSFGGVMTKTVGVIIAINAVIFIVQQMNPLFTPMFALHTNEVFPARIYTLLTYSVLHGSFGHIFFNMLSLYFFAGSLQLYLGVRRFLTIYIGSAIAGGLLSLVFVKGFWIVGASASVLGILTAYAVYFPQSKVLLFFIVPLPIRHFIYLLMAVSIYFSVFGGGGNIAHLAHLGGIIFAFFYCQRWWKPGNIINEAKYRWRRRKFQRIQ
jgi:membrane associated rhomboid family serine protease